MAVDIRSVTPDDLAGLFRQLKQPAYRAGQVLQWVHTRRACSWDEMTNLPKTLRDRLRQAFALEPLTLVTKQGSRDSTQKFLWRLADGAFVESVLIPANPALYGEASDRHTLCVSTQVGCAYGCKFCASGLEGWRRNLAPAEIVDQVYAVERWNRGQMQSAECRVQNEDSFLEPAGHATPTVPDSAALTPRSASRVPRLINNLVVMGMGEPLANYDHLLAALRILNAPWGGGIGARKITVSTSGLAPQIRSLADDPLQLRLAVSLHGATDPVRNRIMPVNRKFPLKELVAACEYYQQQKGRMITFEYILIEGVNDSLSEAAPLAAIARRLHAKVNLIPYNTVEGLPWSRPTEAVCEAFLRELERHGITATLRREKGHDIDAACGQLRLKTEQAHPAAVSGSAQC